MNCRFCGKNLENFIAAGSVYCPFCGAAVTNTSGLPKKDSNIIAGRALWPIKWSLLAVLLSLLILFGITFGVEFIIIIGIAFTNPSKYLTDPNALLNAATTILLNPFIVALLTLTEYSLLILPLILTRKYRRPLKERFLLLGWKPYFGTKAPSPGGWTRFLKDVAVAAVFAMALVGFQFLVNIANNAMWAPFFPSALDISGADQALTSTNVFQMILLVAVMLFAVAPAEESLFRGFSQQGLESRLGEKKAWLISSIIFAFAHVFELLFFAATIPSFLPNFLPYLYLSMILCGIYWKTKNFNRMIYIHGMYDSLLVISAPFITGTYLVPVDSSNLFVWVSMLFFMAFTALLLAKWLMARQHKITLPIVKAQESR